MAYQQSNGTSVPHASGHLDLLAKFKTFVETGLGSGQNWTSLRSVTSGNYEEIWDAPGLAGTSHIYMGLKSYQDAGTGYYNLKVNGFTGFVSSNSFETQPGRLGSDRGIPLWQNSIPYIFVGNGQRAIVVAFVNGLAISFYMGFGLPYNTPEQFPYPLIIGGMLGDAANTLYSNTSYYSWWKDHCNIRFVDGSWRTPNILPFYNAPVIRSTGSDSTSASGDYPLIPLILTDSSPMNYGELDGLYFIPGYNNVQGNTLTISGITYYVFNDVWRVGLMDYVAIKLA